MTYTTDTTPNLLFNIDSADAVSVLTAQFKRLSVDDRLALLWFVYTEIGRSITPAAPGAARLQLAEGLLNTIKQMQPQEQLQVMRDLINKVNTPITRSYGVLSANTKLAFWYQLAEYMKEGKVIQVPSGYKMSNNALKVMNGIEQLDFNQQITVLRNAAADLGVDPLA
ncbi:orange carotenoid protein N-terminal domain-containing protein [Oscillatoria salina]|uniref:orange carotenoid protein N-terminal domain-containing protein n=1 Tax=Oscillatoria salina TaxID=331517 RepID=UPI0013BDFD96|nr:orange carotenoid protein N-terminal domain-containing protein [Oscillatoria salina]MBZ8180032.1 Orange carotenoid protein [Oscillatoria salina IIICB1]NET88918.1 Orange carotenoid protein [Kamptonema sp. SIO1D9]